MIVNTSDKSYFGKTILIIVLSIAIFIVFKNVLPERLFPEKTIASENIVVDSLMLSAMNDSIDAEVDEITPVKTDTIPTGEEVEVVKEVVNPSLNADGYRNMTRFYEKLRKLEESKSGKVRIAYFGDSMNDGDFIVQDVRSLFQENYGGEGVGFVSVSSLSAGSRGSVSHQYSKNWHAQSFVKVKKPIRPFGIDGQVFFAKDSSQTYWVRYRAQSQPFSTRLNKPTLFYGSSNNKKGFLTIKADKDSVFNKSLTPNYTLNTLQLSSRNLKSLQVDFHHADSIPIYGFNFDSGSGIHVDNLSMRGNSGLPLSILNASLMNAFDKELNYDLLILHYGANVLGYGSTKYGWYEKSMTTVVNNLRQCFPNADILVIATADKSTKVDTEMQTDPAVVPLANSQKRYAKNTNSGFISLYEVMGGEGSMIKWVNDGLANKDYTHFNASGSRKIARMIYNEIGKGYKKYKQDYIDKEKIEPDSIE